MTELYGRLAAHFDRHHKDPRGLEYLTGEQVVSRLNEVLGPAGWSFAVKEHGYEAEADELWALGRLEATVDGVSVVREQFGSQKHNRRRSDGQILDHGFDLKGATTDALKKCATLIGVGLYLAEKDGGIPQDDAPKAAGTPARTTAPAAASSGSTRTSAANATPRASAPQPTATSTAGPATSGTTTVPAAPAGARSGAPTTRPPSSPDAPFRERAVDDAWRCVECDQVIVAQTGQPINAGQADIIRDRFGALLCKDHRKVLA